MSIRAKALSVEIAVTDDMFLYVTGDCRWRIIRSDGCFALLKGSRKIFFLFSAVVTRYESARGPRGIRICTYVCSSTYQAVKNFSALEKYSAIYLQDKGPSLCKTEK